MFYICSLSLILFWSIAGFSMDPGFQIKSENPKSNLNQVNKFGRTKAHLAAQLGDLNKIVEISEKNPELFETKDSLGVTPGHFAVGLGHVEIFEVILKSFPRACEAQNNAGETPLHLAAACGNAKLVEIIVNAAPHVIRAKDHDGCYASHMTLRNQDTRCLELIYSQDPLILSVASKKGFTHAHLAVVRGSLEFFQFIVQNVPELLAVCSHDGKTPIHRAAISLCCTKLEYLISEGNGKISDPIQFAMSKKDLDGFSPAYFLEKHLEKLGSQLPEGHRVRVLNLTNKMRKIEVDFYIKIQDPDFFVLEPPSLKQKNKNKNKNKKKRSRTQAQGLLAEAVTAIHPEMDQKAFSGQRVSSKEKQELLESVDPSEIRVRIPLERLPLTVATVSEALQFDSPFLNRVPISAPSHFYVDIPRINPNGGLTDMTVLQVDPIVLDFVPDDSSQTVKSRYVPVAAAIYLGDSRSGRKHVVEWKREPWIYWASIDDGEQEIHLNTEESQRAVTLSVETSATSILYVLEN